MICCAHAFVNAMKHTKHSVLDESRYTHTHKHWHAHTHRCELRQKLHSTSSSEQKTYLKWGFQRDIFSGWNGESVFLERLQHVLYSQHTRATTTIVTWRTTVFESNLSQRHAFFALRKQWPVWHRCIFQMLWLFLKMPGSTFAWEIFKNRTLSNSPAIATHQLDWGHLLVSFYPFPYTSYPPEKINISPSNRRHDFESMIFVARSRFSFRPLSMEPPWPPVRRQTVGKRWKGSWKFWFLLGKRCPFYKL